MATKRLAGVLLDVDGTLLDSNPAHAAAWREALAEAGLSFEQSSLQRLIGMGADQLLPRLGLSDDSDPGATAKKRKGEIFRDKYLSLVRPQPGARALVERMAAVGLERIVVTSARSEEVQALLRAAGVDDLIQAQITSSEAARSKPAPDVVQAAIERARLPPERLAMLGDTPYDVSASLRAGVPIVCLRCGGWNDYDLSGAAAIYDHPAALLARFDESIFA